MHNEFRDWIFGFLFFLIVTTTLYQLNKLLVPYSYFSWLEWYGIFMLFVTLKTGVDSYNENKEK